MKYTINDLCGGAWDNAIENILSLMGKSFVSGGWEANLPIWRAAEDFADKHGLTFDEDGYAI